MKWTEANWRDQAKGVPGFLTPFARPMGRSERGEGAALYVEGLLLPGELKSIEPMAERLGFDSQKLQQLLTDSPWDDREVWQAIRQIISTHLEPLWAWIVDETGWLKQGEHSVGVAHQYCGAEGKAANCQVNVEVAVTDGQVAVPVHGELAFKRQLAVQTIRGNGFANCNSQGRLAAVLGRPLSLRACRWIALDGREPRCSSF